MNQQTQKKENSISMDQKKLLTYIFSSLLVFIIFVILIKAPVNPGYGITCITFFALISIGIYYIRTIDKNYEPKMCRDKKFLKVVLVVVFSYIFYSLIGSSLFFSQDRFNTIEKTTKIENAQDLTNTQNYFKKVDVRTVNLQMAKAKAKRVLGEQFEGRNISSQFELGKGSVILVKGIQQWVFPLEYSSIFKWLSFDYTPGYITVSATDPNKEAELKITKMYFQESGYFYQSVSRKAWVASGLRGYDLHFEIDDKGNPFYVGGLYKKQTFLSGVYTDKSIVINAVSGEVDIYKIGEQPEWIDYVISEKRAEEYLDWNGAYEKGFWNSIWGENLETTTGEGLWSVVLNSKQYFYTGMTSPNRSNNNSLITVRYFYIGMTSPNRSENSLIGVRLFNPRNNEQFVFNNFSGLMDESGALDSIDSALGSDSQRWDVVLPQIKEVDGEYYYFASVISQTGIFQKYGAVDASNSSKVFLANTLEDLERKITLGNDDTEIDSNETIIVNKKNYLKMKELINQLQNLK